MSDVVITTGYDDLLLDSEVAPLGFAGVSPQGVEHDLCLILGICLAIELRVATAFFPAGFVELPDAPCFATVARDMNALGCSGGFLHGERVKDACLFIGWISRQRQYDSNNDLACHLVTRTFLGEEILQVTGNESSCQAFLIDDSPSTIIQHGRSVPCI